MLHTTVLSGHVRRCHVSDVIFHSSPRKGTNQGSSYVRLNYTWINQDRKSVQLPAPTYIDYVMTWVQNLLDDENTFPTKSGTSALPCPVSASLTRTCSCAHFTRTGLPRFVPVNHQTRLPSALARFRAYIPRALSSNSSSAFRTALQLALCTLPCIWS